MDEALAAIVGLAVGVAATLGWLGWTLRRAKREWAKAGASRQSPGQLTGRQGFADDPGSGNVSCVILRYNPYFSAYCVNTATGESWYVPR